MAQPTLNSRPSGRTAFCLGLFLLVVLVSPLVGATSATTWDLQTTYAGDIPVTNATGYQQTACIIADLDGDGVDDFVIGERTEAPSMVAYFWRETGWESEVIDSSQQRVEAGGAAADVDNDGDLDIILGGDSASNKLWWWENPGSPPYTSDWTRRYIKNDGQRHQHDQVVGDFDGDGELELVFWNKNDDNRLFLAHFPADPRNTQPWPRVEIFAAPAPAEGLVAADINLDDKEDIVGGGFWFEHVSGDQYTAHTIAADRTWTRSAVAQIIPGGRPEVVIGPGDDVGPLRWYQWQNDTWAATELDDEVLHGHSLAIGDVDKNGLPDIYIAEMHTPGGGDLAESRIFLNQGGGIFALDTISVGVANHESKLADVNGDGWLDIVGKPFSHLSPGLNVWLQLPEAVAVAGPPALRAVQVVPNPFNARCTVRFSSDQPREVAVEIYDVRGRHVLTLADRVSVTSGESEFTWNGATSSGTLAPSGTYFVRVSAADWTDVLKVVMAK